MTCQCPPDDPSRCLHPSGERFAHTACVSCGVGFECEGDIGATTLGPGPIYPVCHPQDCRPPTAAEKSTWDERWRQ